jgi:N-acetylglucosamine-6-phosphate deacetylase
MAHLTYIHHARLLTYDEGIESAAILIEGDRIRAIAPAEQLACPPGARRLDATGLMAVPGFIDLQFNGAFGQDFTADPHGIWPAAAQLPRYGTTTFLPTIITSPPEVVAAAQQAVVERPAGFVGAEPLGLHVEGPFLNPAKRGAHNPTYLRLPDMAVIADWSPERGVRLVTLAPELDGALDLVRVLTGRGVVVSAGHSMATHAEALAAFEAGVTYGTHLFNAMPPLDHREPGLVGALLADSHVTTGMIVDGIHIHPAMVALAYHCKGPAGVSLVTDAIAALGMPPGRYMLGDFEVIVDEVAARLADGRLAGSILSLDQAIRNLIAFGGCSIADAIAAVTTVPARLLGLTDRGRLASGCRADVVLLTPDLKVAKTLVGGQVAYAAIE